MVVATITAGLGLPLALGPHDLGQLSAEDRLELVSKNGVKNENWLNWLGAGQKTAERRSFGRWTQ